MITTREEIEFHDHSTGRSVKYPSLRTLGIEGEMIKAIRKISMKHEKKGMPRSLLEFLAFSAASTAVILAPTPGDVRARKSRPKPKRSARTKDRRP